MTVSESICGRNVAGEGGGRSQVENLRYGRLESLRYSRRRNCVVHSRWFTHLFLRSDPATKTVP